MRAVRTTFVSSSLCVLIILEKIDTQRLEDTKSKFFSFREANRSHSSQTSSVISVTLWLIMQQNH